MKPFSDSRVIYPDMPCSRCPHCVTYNFPKKACLRGHQVSSGYKRVVKVNGSLVETTHCTDFQKTWPQL